MNVCQDFDLGKAHENNDYIQHITIHIKCISNFNNTKATTASTIKKEEKKKGYLEVTHYLENETVKPNGKK